ARRATRAAPTAAPPGAIADRTVRRPRSLARSSSVDTAGPRAAQGCLAGGRVVGLASMSSPSSDPYFQRLFAERIGGAQYGKGTDIYKFEKIKRAKRQALADHPERTLIDFGIGENDAMAPEPVRRRMAEEIGKPENRGYADNGIPAFKEAAARFMQRFFGVTLDPATEVNHCIGSKPALAMIPACFIDPGDVTLMTVPGYPVAGTHTKYYGGEVHRLPLLPQNDYLPDLDGIPADVRRR